MPTFRPSPSQPSTIQLPAVPMLTSAWSGLFISRGVGRHMTRSIDTHELIVVRSGTLHLQEDGSEFAVGPGQTLLLVAGRTHGGTRDYDHDLSFYWLHFSCPGLRSSTGAVPANRLAFPQHAQPRRPELLMEWMHRFLDDQASGLATATTARLHVHLILAELAAGPRRGGAVADPAVHLVGRAEAWIGQHYHESISTSDVARALDHNPDYLGRVFRRCLGHSIVEAIHQRRIAAARRLLIEDTADVQAIAQRVGFNAIVHFRRCFRRQVGCSPGAFRSLHARAHVNSD